MANNKTHTTRVNKQFRDDILRIMELIAIDILGESQTSDYSQYGNQRDIISNVFNCSGNSRGDIIVRLAILDQFYSTGFYQRYFGFDDLAHVISCFNTRHQARNYFYKIACGGNDSKGLFDLTYGIQKTGKHSNKAMSLLSKYAYFEILQEKGNCPLGFPIYDSLVKKIYNNVCDKLNVTPPKRLFEQTNICIKDYVACLNFLREIIFGNNTDLFKGYFQQFDILDAYLWRMGKYDGGNLSILLNRKDYPIFASNINNYPITIIPSFDDKVKHALDNGWPIFNDCTKCSFLTELRDHWKNLTT